MKIDVVLEKKLPIPGEAIPMRLNTTWVIPHFAAFEDSPSTLPFSSDTGIPLSISL